MKNEYQKIIKKCQEIVDLNHRDSREKSPNQLVTETDVTIEKLLVQELSQLVPEASFITEENTIGQAGSINELMWIIDPIDGTTNFVHNLPAFCTSVALYENGVGINGFVYEYNRKEFFYADDKGAEMDHQAIKVSQSSELKDCLFATGFPYRDFDAMQSYLKVLKELMPKTRGLRRMGSAAIDLAYTACGRFDGFFEYGLSSWDVAAGILLVEKAGGLVNDFLGGNNCLFGEEIVASSDHIHQDFMGIIQDAFYPGIA